MSRPTMTPAVLAALQELLPREDVVEAAAKAEWDFSGGPKWDKTGPHPQSLAAMRAALSAVLELAGASPMAEEYENASERIHRLTGYLLEHFDNERPILDAVDTAIRVIDRYQTEAAAPAANLRPSLAHTRRAPQVIPPEFEAALLRRVEEDPDAETAELLDRYHGDLYRQLIQEAWGAAYAAALGYQVTVSESGDRLEVGDQTADRSPATPTTADDIFAEPDAIARNYPHLHQDGGDRA